MLASAPTEKVLRYLDMHSCAALNSLLSLNLSGYFFPFYRYTGKLHAAIYILLETALNRILEQYKEIPVNIFNNYFKSLPGSTQDLHGFIEDFFSDCGRINVIQRSGPSGRNSILRKMYRTMTGLIKKIKIHKQIDQKKTAAERTNNSAKLLVSGGLYNLRFLEQCTEFQLIEEGGRKTACLPETELIKNIEISNLFNKLEGRLFNDFKIHFAYNTGLLLGPVQSVRDHMPVDAGISGNLSWDSAILQFEYLRSLGIPRILMQHGNVYGDQYYPGHFDSDYDQCDYFLSYGFIKADLDRTYPGRAVESIIVPVGKPAVVRGRAGRKHIDILFPVTNAFSILDFIHRIPAHELLERQVEILKYFNSRKDLSTVVKPFPGSSFEYTPVLMLAEKLPNTDFVYNTTLNEFLDHFLPKAVIIEYPSTPLAELISEDVEIFLMNDPVIPYEKSALEKLMKRVHYFENTADLISAVDCFFTGNLPSKRDITYAENYVSIHDVENRIVKYINNTVLHKSNVRPSVK